MMDPIQLFNSVSTVQPGILPALSIVGVAIKWGVVLLLGVYSIMAALLLRQMSAMEEQLEDRANGAIKNIALIHLLASLLLTLAVILVG